MNKERKNEESLPFSIRVKKVSEQIRLAEEYDKKRRIKEGEHGKK